MRAFSLTVLAAAAIALAAPVFATAPIHPRTQAELNAAPLLVTGTVQAIRTHQMRTGACQVRIDYIVTIAPDAEQPTAASPAPMAPMYVRVRGFHTRWRCVETTGHAPTSRPPGNYGLHALTLLRAGDRVRVHAKPSDLHDGTFDILAPNGLELLN